MSGDKDKLKGTFDETKGKVKAGIGDLTDSPTRRAEGQDDQAKGKGEQALGGVKNAAGDAKDAVKKTFDRDRNP